MRWLIDGYNVIRRDPDLRAAEAAGLEAGRRALLARLAPLAMAARDRFTVVFDGAPGFGPSTTGGAIEVMFSRPPESADDVLRRLARQAGGGGAVVVSSDRAVVDAARRSGCATVTAEEFLVTLAGGGPGDDEEGDEPRSSAKRGNPRRLSKQARRARRVLRRLRGPG
jgi:predicted RNA-binding protein with PIN domain